MTQVIGARAVYTPAGVRTDHVVRLDTARRIREVRPWRSGDPELLDGLLVPGLINAHLHLELSWMAGRVAPGGGFVAWFDRSQRVWADAPSPEARETLADEAATRLLTLGTVAVADVANQPGGADRLMAVGLSGVAHREWLTLHAPRVPEVARAAGAPGCLLRDDRCLIVDRSSPHALYSTAPQIVRACLRQPLPRFAPATLHLYEDVAERTFLSAGEGPFASLLDRLERDWRWWTPPGSVAEALFDVDGVGQQLLLVHGVHLNAADRQELAGCGVCVVLCPRSNRWIGGQLPDVPGLIDDGFALALGTDSLASNDDLDVLGEIPELARAFPDVPADVWLDAATQGGGLALGMPHLGAIGRGRAPGLVLLEGLRGPEGLRHGPPPRRLLVAPGVP